MLPVLAPFDHRLGTRIVFGPGTAQRVGEFAATLPARRVLLVTDPGIVAAGHAARVSASLDSAGIEVIVFQQVEENPSTVCVEKCLVVARKAEVDAIVGLGGGSSMDTAKGCNFLLTNGGEIKDYWGVNKARLPMLPLIALPTTAGTGSECQSFAIITDPATHQKMACGDSKAAARIAILDPLLTLSQPAGVTACTGIDAIAHAVETAVTRKRTPLSSIFSREAFRLAAAAFPQVVARPDDLDARGAMQLAAAWAGTAIETSMLGGAHSAANPLTARFGIVHGKAVGMMLPHVVRFNSDDPAAASIYADLATAAGLTVPTASPRTAALALAEKLEEFLTLAGLQRSVSPTAFSPRLIEQLAAEAASQWTAQFNPRPISAEDFRDLYACVLAPG